MLCFLSGRKVLPLFYHVVLAFPGGKDLLGMGFFFLIIELTVITT